MQIIAETPLKHSPKTCKSFLWLVLPYDSVLDENPIRLMTDCLLEALPLLDWLDYESLQSQVAQELAA